MASVCLHNSFFCETEHPVKAGVGSLTLSALTGYGCVVSGGAIPGSLALIGWVATGALAFLGVGLIAYGIAQQRRESFNPLPIGNNFRPQAFPAPAVPSSALSGAVQLTPSLQDRFSGVVLCPAKDDWKHRLFLTTNEKIPDDFLDEIGRQPACGNTFVGVSGLFSLTLAALRPDEVENLIIVDRSSRVEYFWEQVSTLITEAPNKESFIESLRDLVWNGRETYFKDAPPRGVERVYPDDIYIVQMNLFRKSIPGSWLGNTTQFQRIQSIFRNGRFAFLRLDFIDQNCMESLQKKMHEEGLRLDTLYISNCLEYVWVDGIHSSQNQFFRFHKKKFVDRIQGLFSESGESILISSQRLSISQDALQLYWDKVRRGQIQKAFFDNVSY